MLFFTTFSNNSYAFSLPAAFSSPATNSVNSFSYTPTSCNVTQYVFSFLWSSTSNEYKVHGLWPNVCDECSSCGYPSCCSNASYYPPTIQSNTDFIEQHWYNSTAKDDCSANGQHIPLFQHEYQKHGSCAHFSTSDEYAGNVSTLFDKYRDVATNMHDMCQPLSQQPWLYLNGDYQLQSAACM